MTKTRIRDFIAVLFVLSHFWLILLVGILYVYRGFTFEEMTTTIAIVVPMTAAYTTAVVRFVLSGQDMHGDSGAVERFVYVFISLFIPILFVAVLTALIFLRAYNVGVSTFEQFKILLGIVEAVFASYVGLVISALFPSIHRRSATNAVASGGGEMPS